MIKKQKCICPAGTSISTWGPHPGLIDQKWAFSCLRGTISLRNETQEVVSGWKGLALC